jgi:hypothetical protein
MTPRRLGPLDHVVVGYLALSVYEPWARVLIRGAVEGTEFSWGFGLVGGVGAGGWYWLVVALVAYGSMTLSLGWRGDPRRFAAAVVPWALLLVAQSLALVVLDPGSRMVGETIGLDAPAGAMLLPFDVAFLVAVLASLARWRRQHESDRRPAWSAANRIFGLLALLLLAVTAVLFRVGEQHGPSDVAAVASSFTCWVAVNLALYPWSYRGVAGAARTAPPRARG